VGSSKHSLIKAFILCTQAALLSAVATGCGQPRVPTSELRSKLTAAASARYDHLPHTSWTISGIRETRGQSYRYSALVTSRVQVPFGASYKYKDYWVFREGMWVTEGLLDGAEGAYLSGEDVL